MSHVPDRGDHVDADHYQVGLVGTELLKQTLLYSFAVLRLLLVSAPTEVPLNFDMVIFKIVFERFLVMEVRHVNGRYHQRKTNYLQKERFGRGTKNHINVIKFVHVVPEVEC